ncbi:conserved Plasmodium protein, unknown function [Plasmodium gallinaceum]|uniref:Pre-mRNA polyadenylation factor Fip1 domain-containing protein n=1 Tax=Plasmodium gallinaceum TaxID=5849 RepID=A0A1J1GWG4_PLAGA|nr:conserved Plasmodium protein, unknown function [Plasmodium gallinaceum]CRG96889.1 conserved Plasmodium protein, unknown function [Plasmodium gallinaceum]
MEDTDDEENVQVIVFGNSSKADFDDFYREEIIKEKNDEDKNNTNTNNSIKNEIQNEEIEDLDLDAQVLKATKENKVFMKYEYTNEKPWLYHNDISMWFNYNFDENSFKEWIQKHIDRRIEKHQNYQIENSDNIYNENFKNNINTSAYEDDLQISKNPNYKNQNIKNKMKYKNTKNNFYNNKNNILNNFNKDNSSIDDENYFDNDAYKNEDFYTYSNINKSNGSNKDIKNNFTQNYIYSNNNNASMNNYNNNNNNNINKLRDDTVDIPIQNDDLRQLQNLINFFKENPEV